MKNREYEGRTPPPQSRGTGDGGTGEGEEEERMESTEDGMRRVDGPPLLARAK